MSSDLYAAHEPHPWLDLTPDEVLDRLVQELYAPVSALGSEVDRLASGAFEDDDLLPLLDQIRENVNTLGRLVVTLKQYSRDRHSDPAPSARDTQQ
jgi:signal transduction histidine kinase